MKIQFIKTDYENIKSYVKKQSETLSSPVDSFYEEHLFASEFYHISYDDTIIGATAIHKGDMIIFFYIDDIYRDIADDVYYKLKKFRYIQSAFVPTCDEFYMSYAIDEFVEVKKQAYFFTDSKKSIKPKNKIKLRLAVPEDKDDILNNSVDFFGDDVDKNIERNEVYMATIDGALVGFGVIERSKLNEKYASTGMYTLENHRRKGIGRDIILGLKEIVYKEGRAPIAGCWYYNHFSKSTLQKAGYVTNTRLLKITY